MAEQRRENSLLVSLRELKEIETDRVKEEEDAVQARAEAERRAQEDAIRQAKEAEERKIREAEDKLRREREERERKIREEQLRLSEAERRAQVEAEAKLAEVRIQQEARIKASKAVPVRMIVGIAITVLVVAGSITGYEINKSSEQRAEAERITREKLRAQREAAERAEAQRKQELADQKRTMDELNKKLAGATTEADRARIRAQMADSEKATSRRRKDGDSGAKKPSDTGKAAGTDSDTTDPLGNLPGMNN